MKIQFKFLEKLELEKPRFQIEIFQFLDFRFGGFSGPRVAPKGHPRAGEFRPTAEIGYLRSQIDPPSLGLVGPRMEPLWDPANFRGQIWSKIDHF